jgi:hypothetical protein
MKCFGTASNISIVINAVVLEAGLPRAMQGAREGERAKNRAVPLRRPLRTGAPFFRNLIQQIPSADTIAGEGGQKAEPGSERSELICTLTYGRACSLRYHERVIANRHTVKGRGWTMERDTRTRLMEGLHALENSDHALDFRTAFYFLRLYVAGPAELGDVELRHAFARVFKAIEHRASPQ